MMSNFYLRINFFRPATFSMRDTSYIPLYLHCDKIDNYLKASATSTFHELFDLIYV